MSHYGCVSSGHPFTTFIGTETLKAGGNAFDAITACGFAASLAEPLLTSLGGGGLLIGKDNDELFCYDFFTNFPGLEPKDFTPTFTTVTVDFSSSSQDFKVGPGSIAVPGTIKGLLHTHQQKGNLPLKKLLKPIIKAAVEGLKFNKTQSYVLSLLDPVARFSKEGQELYVRDDRLLKEGDLFNNKPFAHFLEKIEDLAEDIYSGSLAKQTLDICNGQNLLSAKDLLNYRVVESAPLEFSYNQAQIHTVPPPAHGGHYLKLLFAFLENQEMKGVQWGSFEHLKHISDILIQLEEGKSSSQFHPFTKGTTHISITDREGNCASLSLTNGEGSGIFIPDTGIMLNNMLGEDDVCSDDPTHWKPGQRLPSMMAPCIVERSGRPTIVTGSGGSKRIRSSLLQIICNLLDFNLPLAESILAPRLNWDGEALQIEPGYDQSVMKELKSHYPINLWDDLEFYFGGTHTVIANSKAVGDPRRGGFGKTIKL